MVLQTIPNDESTSQAETNASSSLVEVIETVIASLDSGQTAMVNRSEEGHLWKFKYGTVEVFVQLTGLSEEDTLMVWAAVLKLPAKDEPKLMRQLLEKNWSDTLEARFSIMNNEVVVVTNRSIADLSPSELSRAITIVATIADESDEPLIAEFGT
ncbi:MAG: YbjN domain-containing protein [Leptolyngbyaceae cyanobacterium CAN_BIN12]|nr:YbjN domain-containing protein [Leptolyngbyaceae cyanobacterium CAN_BIN12]